MLETLTALLISSAVALTFSLGRKALLVSFFAIFVFSNIAISISSQWITTKLTLNILQGIDFLIACIIATIAISGANKKINKTKELSGYTTVLLMLVAYYILGTINNGFINSSIYFRMLAYPILLLIIGAWSSRFLSFRDASRLLYLIGIIATSYVIIEFLNPQLLYWIIDAKDFYSLKLDISGLDTASLIEMRTRRPLNIYLLEDYRVFRAAGPTFNYPSSSYVLIFGFTCAIITRRYLGALYIAIGTIILGTKAGIATLLLVTVATLLYKFTKKTAQYLTYLTLTCYILLTFSVMSGGNNIHYYSLVSSIINIPKNIIGKGIGWGGSMTVDRTVTWTYDMLVGDSGLAIALNMLGLSSILLYYYYLKCFKETLTKGAREKSFDHFILGYLGITIILNSIIQELALGPYAVGIALFLTANLMTQRKQHDEEISNRIK